MRITLSVPAPLKTTKDLRLRLDGSVLAISDCSTSRKNGIVIYMSTIVDEKNSH